VIHRYVLVGICCSVLGPLLTLFLMRYVNPFTSVAGASTVIHIGRYVAHRQYVFQAKDVSIRRTLTYVLGIALQILLDGTILTLFVHLTDNELLSVILMNVLASTYLYVMSKYVFTSPSFRNLGK